MEGREQRAEEGLFIPEFTNDFFKNRLESEQGLKEMVQGCSKRALELQKTGEKGLWHSIFEAVLEAACEKELKDYFRNGEEIGNCSRLRRVMLDFYGEPTFLMMDVAQAVTYNLYRLDRTDRYDMEDEKSLEEWEGQYRGLLDFGRDMRGKDLSVDLLPGLERLRQKYEKTGDKLKVIFPGLERDKEIILESAFAELNVLYIGNEKFQEYLHWKERVRRWNTEESLPPKKDFFQMLLNLVKTLDETGMPQQYVWEKMTDFNALNITAKFLTGLVKNAGRKGDGIKAVETILRENYYLFRQIAGMPNVLTRLLFLKKAFRCMSENPEELRENFKELNMFLKDANCIYKKIREIVQEMAALTRWRMDGEHRANRNHWLKELEQEYPISWFEQWLLTLNLDCGLYKISPLPKVNEKLQQGGGEPERIRRSIKKYAEQGREEQGAEEWTEAESAYSRFQEWKKNPWNAEAYDERKYELATILGGNRYYDCGDEPMEKLQKEGWINVHSESYAKFVDRQEAVSSEITPCGRIVTMTKSEFQEKCPEAYQETVENIRVCLQPCLLSEYKNVIFENTHMDCDRTYKEIFNLSLYHVWK